MEGSVFSRNHYVEYIPGTMNVIISAPHGGNLKPPDIPARDAGGYIGDVFVYNHSPRVKKDPEKFPVRKKKDINTKEISLCTAQHIMSISGKKPHVIISHLHRERMDPNCDREKGSFCNKAAEDAWTAYHSFIETAQRTIAGAGLLLDIHGQVHNEDWIELGYAMSQEVLNSCAYTPEMTSVYSLYRNSKHKAESITEVISGASSFGALLTTHGYDVVPSPKNIYPGDCNYYTGGFITQVHGSKNGGNLDAIQVECPSSQRKNDNVNSFSSALAKTIVDFVELHYT